MSLGEVEAGSQKTHASFRKSCKGRGFAAFSFQVYR